MANLAAHDTAQRATTKTAEFSIQTDDIATSSVRPAMATQTSFVASPRISVDTSVATALASYVAGAAISAALTDGDAPASQAAATLVPDAAPTPLPAAPVVTFDAPPAPVDDAPKPLRSNGNGGGNAAQVPETAADGKPLPRPSRIPSVSTKDLISKFNENKDDGTVLAQGMLSQSPGRALPPPRADFDVDALEEPEGGHARDRASSHFESPGPSEFASLVGKLETHIENTRQQGGSSGAIGGSLIGGPGSGKNWGEKQLW